MDINKIWLKITSREKYQNYKSKKNNEDKIKKFRESSEYKIKNISKVIKEKKEITFLHSGHLGDIINSLPLIKEVSKTKKCNFLVEANKPLPTHLQDSQHPFGKFFLSEDSVKKMIPLLKSQTYINEIELYNGQKIDVDLNLFREMPINFNFDSVRWYFHLTGVHGNLNEPYLINIGKHNIKNKILIIRSKRRRNHLINYNFLSNYNDVLFLGLKNEYDDLKKSIKNLEFYDCKNFLEMAEIVNSCKVFIGNLSFGFTLAEALKKPRLLESGPDFPLVYPNGDNAYDFYFQNHFEILFKKLYSK